MEQSLANTRLVVFYVTPKIGLWWLARLWSKRFPLMFVNTEKPEVEDRKQFDP